MTQSLPRRWGTPSVDNSSRRGEQPQRAAGQTTVNHSTSPVFPLLVAAVPALHPPFSPPSQLQCAHPAKLQLGEPFSERDRHGAPTGTGRGTDEQ